MSDLDSKLREIISGDILGDWAVEQIKQAFADEGYVEARSKWVAIAKQMEAYKTGQEWYNRFEKELGKWSSLTLQDTQEPLIVQSRSSVMEAAKKAAGLKDV